MSGGIWLQLMHTNNGLLLLACLSILMSIIRNFLPPQFGIYPQGWIFQIWIHLDSLIPPIFVFKPSQQFIAIKNKLFFLLWVSFSCQSTPLQPQLFLKLLNHFCETESSSSLLTLTFYMLSSSHFPTIFFLRKWNGQEKLGRSDDKVFEGKNWWVENLVWCGKSKEIRIRIIHHWSRPNNL